MCVGLFLVKYSPERYHIIGVCLHLWTLNEKIQTKSFFVVVVSKDISNTASSLLKVSQILFKSCKRNWTCILPLLVENICSAYFLQNRRPNTTNDILKYCMKSCTRPYAQLEREDTVVQYKEQREYALSWKKQTEIMVFMQLLSRKLDLIGLVFGRYSSLRGLARRVRLFLWSC